ncbi:TetR family transcriptional regulator [Cryobacterium sp. PH29-G1]|uniref:TetR family transcriptional regulator n=1 Tax=Cryobacterium sp. PH29-G1 TaxID=3046211 RepID=UPI0024B9A676|nr:TetR family transcriptional regulator [Cryobacterium sp. PH29-G1]MDJ0347724.1 TetR family transcriptional regulator [Cryobacterium sp. PH29-G1]
MALSRGQIVDAALAILHEYGLASLSMRQLAKALGVQPGALYWHVKNKHDLLAAVADRLLAPVVTRWSRESGGVPSAQTRQIVLDLRLALLSVRDGAEIVSLAQALEVRPLPATRVLRDALGRELDERRAEWGARALTHYLLGAVAEEQNYAELTRAGLVPVGTSSPYSDEAFVFGVDAILHGLTSPAVVRQEEPAPGPFPR